MMLLTTALMIEARPLVAALGLRGFPGEAFPLFRNDRYLLVVSGTGPLRAAAATAWSLGRFPDLSVAVNLGFCGASPGAAPPGSWHYVHSVRDAASGRLHVPDIPWRHPFPEAGLRTFPLPVTENTGRPELVDMEGSGFMEAARSFLAPDRVVILKWVSDHLQGTLDSDSVARSFAAGLSPVIDFLTGFPLPETAPGDDPGEALLEAVLERLRATRTQEAFLRRWIHGFLARGGDPAHLLDRLPAAPPGSRRDNNRLYEELKHVFENEDIFPHLS
jgi:hypothetical protein